jgi:hypothetical protein
VVIDGHGVGMGLQELLVAPTDVGVGLLGKVPK